MLEKLSNWWNREEIRTAELNRRIEEVGKQAAEAVNLALKQAADEKQRLLEEAEVEHQRLEAEIAALTVDHSQSTEPWVEVKSERVDPIKGLVIELDWNDAFVQYLKDNGITGRDEETIVQKYLAMLYQNMVVGLETQSIEESDKPRINDYE